MAAEAGDYCREKDEAITGGTAVIFIHNMCNEID